MLILGNHFYIANTDALLEFDYHPVHCPQWFRKADYLLPGSGPSLDEKYYYERFERQNFHSRGFFVQCGRKWY